MTITNCLRSLRLICNYTYKIDVWNTSNAPRFIKAERAQGDDVKPSYLLT